MSGSSSSFLTKSIILLALVLIFMGVSMYLGRELGRNIMAVTRSNIEMHYPDIDSADAGDTEENVLYMGAERSSFGYDSDEFGMNQFPRDWADPEEGDLTVTSGEPIVDISVMDPDGEITDENGNIEETGTENGGEDSGNNANIFDLGVETAFKIQVGTYTLRENAESVWNNLTQAGYDARLSTYTGEDQIMYRVAVGTYSDREAADAIAEEIRRMGFDAWVQEIIKEQE